VTFLEAINSVLRRLREDTVGSSNSTDYSKLIGDFVNQAYKEVQDSWDWLATERWQTTGSITTISGTSFYELANIGGTASRDVSVVKEVINVTDSVILKRVDSSYLFRDQTIAPQSGSPTQWDVRMVNNEETLSLWLNPIPDGVYDIALRWKMKRTAFDLDGTDDSKNLETVPDEPVILRAYELAVIERGEDGGMSISDAHRNYRESLGNAIALDAANKASWEMDWNAI